MSALDDILGALPADQDLAAGGRLPRRGAHRRRSRCCRHCSVACRPTPTTPPGPARSCRPSASTTTTCSPVAPTCRPSTSRTAPPSQATSSATRRTRWSTGSVGCPRSAAPAWAATWSKKLLPILAPMVLSWLANKVLKGGGGGLGGTAPAQPAEPAPSLPGGGGSAPGSLDDLLRDVLGSAAGSAGSGSVCPGRWRVTGRLRPRQHHRRRARRHPRRWPALSGRAARAAATPTRHHRSEAAAHHARVGRDVEVDGDAEDAREPPRQQPHLVVPDRQRPLETDRAPIAAAGTARPAPTAGEHVPVARRRADLRGERPARRDEHPDEQRERDGDVHGAPVGLGPEREPVAARSCRATARAGPAMQRSTTTPPTAAIDRPRRPASDDAAAPRARTPARLRARSRSCAHARNEVCTARVATSSAPGTTSSSHRSQAAAARASTPARATGRVAASQAARAAAAPGRRTSRVREASTPDDDPPSASSEQHARDPRHRQVAVGALHAELGGGQVVRRVVDVARVRARGGRRRAPRMRRDRLPRRRTRRATRCRATAPGAGSSRGTPTSSRSTSTS